MRLEIQSHVKQIRRNLQKWNIEINFGGAPDRLRGILEAAIEWTTAELAWVREKKVKVQASFVSVFRSYHGREALPYEQEPFADHFLTQAGRYAQAGAWFLLCLDGALSALMSIWFLNAGRLTAAVVGIAVTLLLAVPAKGLFAPFALAKYSDRPKAGLHWALRCVLILGTAELFLLWLLFVVRGTSSETPLLSIIWWIATSVLAVGTPVLAGISFVLARLLFWSWDHSYDWETLASIERELGTFKSRCEQSLAVLDKSDLTRLTGASGPPPSTHSSSPPSQLKVGTAAIVVFALATLLSTMPERLAAQEPSQTGCDHFPTGELFIDVSPSPLPGQIDSSILQFRDLILADPSGTGACKWEVIPFYEDGAYAVATRTTPALPEPFKDPECPPIKLTELARLFRGPALKEDEAAKEQCQSQRMAAFNDHKKLIAELRGIIDAALTKPIPHKPGRCTSLMDVLDRVRRSTKPLRVAVLTDGVESCRKSFRPSAPPTSDVRVVVLLVPTKGHTSGISAGEGLDLRAHQILQFASWVIVVNSPAFSFDLFKSTRPSVISSWQFSNRGDIPASPASAYSEAAFGEDELYVWCSSPETFARHLLRTSHNIIQEERPAVFC